MPTINGTNSSDYLSAWDYGYQYSYNTIRGYGGSDTIVGGEYGDTLDGGTGADYMYGGYGYDYYLIDSVSDYVEDYGYSWEWDTARSTAASWSMGYGVEALELVGSARAGYGNDLANDIKGNGGANVIDGAQGNDTLGGLGGNDTMYGGSGNDDIGGGQGNDQMFGDDGNDRLFAEAGNDSASGGVGNDSLYGGDGIDTLNGDAGNDVLYCNGGRDVVYGGAGRDTFIFAAISDSPVGANADQLRSGGGGTAFDGAGAAAGDWIDLSAIDANLNVAGDQAFVFGGGTGIGRVLVRQQRRHDAGLRQRRFGRGGRVPDRHLRWRRPRLGLPGVRLYPLTQGAAPQRALHPCSVAGPASPPGARAVPRDDGWPGTPRPAGLMNKVAKLLFRYLQKDARSVHQGECDV